MAITVPTPAVQGPSQLGTVQSIAADTPFQNLQVPDLGFNARMLQRIGGDAVAFAEQLQDREDERLLLEMQAEYGNFERGLLYGDMSGGAEQVTLVGGGAGDALPDAAGTGGLLGSELEYAFGATERTQAALQEWFASQSERMQGLSGNGRLAAETFANSRYEALVDQVTRFEFQQREAYNARLRAQAVAAAAATYETAWVSPEVMAVEEARLAGAVATEASATASAALAGGMSEDDLISGATTSMAVIEDAVDIATADAIETYRRNAIQVAIAQGGTRAIARAREIYDESVEEGVIRLRENDPITRNVTFAEARDIQMTVAVELMELYPDDLGAAVEDLRARGFSGEDEGYILQRLQDEYNRVEVIEQQRLDNIYDDLFADARANAMDSADPRLAELTEGQRATLDTINAGRPLLSMPWAIDLLSSLPQQDLANVNLRTEYYDILDPVQYEYWRTRVAQAQAAEEGDRAAARANAQLDTVNNAVREVARVYLPNEQQALQLRTYIVARHEAAVAADPNGEGLTYGQTLQEAEAWVSRQSEILPGPPTGTPTDPVAEVTGTFEDALPDIRNQVGAADEVAERNTAERVVRQWAITAAPQLAREPNYEETMQFFDSAPEFVLTGDTGDLRRRDRIALEDAGLVGARAADAAIALYNAGVEITPANVLFADALQANNIPVTADNIAAMAAED